MSSIGTLSEKSLHAALKQWVAQPEDQFEVKIGRFVIDIVRDEQLIEIQTRHLYAMKRKLSVLLETHSIRLIHPIPHSKWIVKQTAAGSHVSRRKSPKRGSLLHIFGELVRIPHLLLHPNLTLEVLLTHQEEIWRDDGQGSWRRRGQSLHDHHLLDVVDRAVYRSASDYLAILPETLAQPFTNKQLAKALKCKPRLATQITYTLRHMELLEMVGKDGRSNLYQVIENLGT
ncbi:MAG: hypothetical protein AAF614_43810 [Chloroflexota bacterium]